LKDLVDLPKQAKAELKIVPVKHMDDVLIVALAADPVLEPPRSRKQPREEGED
jgi:ATP-dependent Lon protease